MLYRYSSLTNPQYSIIIHTNHTCSPVSRWRRVSVILAAKSVNSKYTWKDNLAAIFEAKLKAAIDNRGVKK